MAYYGVLMDNELVDAVFPTIEEAQEYVEENEFQHIYPEEDTIHIVKMKIVSTAVKVPSTIKWKNK